MRKFILAAFVAIVYLSMSGTVKAGDCGIPSAAFFQPQFSPAFVPSYGVQRNFAVHHAPVRNDVFFGIGQHHGHAPSFAVAFDRGPRIVVRPATVVVRPSGTVIIRR